ncbi:MAG: MopE-related protein, partial [Bacteroidota bacterium]
NVYVTGPWCGWCGAEAYNVLTDANGDGIYSVTVELPAGTVEYKYMVDNWSSQENLVDDMQNGATCAPVTDYWSYANRTSTVGGSTNDVYGRCSACPILGCMNATACNYNALATQDDGSCVLPSLTFYTDADGDGYGAGSGTQYCSTPGAGYSSNNQDCNDALAAVRPGVSEVCSTNYDDNCNGQINEGCTAVPGDEPSNAASIAQSQWPNCSSVSGTLVGATASSSAQTICLTGEDKWHQFVATSEAISIQVNSSAFDAVIELQSASGALVGSENAVSGIGSEILNIGGLTAGQVYKVGVRNYNSANGNGTYTICVKKLKRGGCDYGPGPYTLCQYFKASWAGGSGAQYRFTFTGLSGAASGNVYTKTQSSDICVLSSVTPTLPYGSNYNVLITTIYSLADGAGNIETIEVPALSPCSLTTSPEATSQLRASDNCSAGPRFRSAVVASLPWSCGAVNWRWEFIEVDASLNAVGLPIYFNRGTASNYLNLGTVASLQYGKTYAVRTAPIFTYTGSNYNWGPVQYMCIVGQSGFVTEGEDQTTDFEKVENFEFNATLFPNPTQGNEATLQLATPTDGKIYV